MKVAIHTTFINESGEVGTSMYADGQTALLFAPDTGEPAWALSTNLAGHGLHAPDGHVFVKGYSEHEGLAKELERLEVATPVQEVTFGPYSTTATLMQLSEGVQFIG